MSDQGMPWGPDVSSWQGEIDWLAVVNAGASFTMIKASEGTSYHNPQFEYDWSEAKGHALDRFAYHYARPDLHPGDDGARAEADWLVECVERFAGGLQEGDGLALDIETGIGNLSGWVLAFLQLTEALVGFKPLCYTSPSFAQEHQLWRRKEIGHYGLWLASWRQTMPAAPKPWDLLAFWQYTSNGQVDGISGAVDLNYFNGPENRIKWYGKPPEGGWHA